jgi:hypothetical protein
VRSGRPELLPAVHGVCRTCDLSGSLHWADENWGWPATSTHTGAGEPVEVYGAGVSVAAGLLLRAVRHEALVDRMEVRDLHRLAVVAAG